MRPPSSLADRSARDRASAARGRTHHTNAIAVRTPAYRRRPASPAQASGPAALGAAARSIQRGAASLDKIRRGLAANSERLRAGGPNLADALRRTADEMKRTGDDAPAATKPTRGLSPSSPRVPLRDFSDRLRGVAPVDPNFGRAPADMNVGIPPAGSTSKDPQFGRSPRRKP